MTKLLFIAFFLLYTIVAADDFGTDPCPNDKVGYCMNAKAIEYVNELRREGGRSALSSGSIYMFDNAMDHSKVQDRAGDIFHQPIGSGVQVGQGQCRTTLTGENVAFYSNGRIKNAAMYCVMDLWKNSPGHYRNMMTPTHRNTVIAIIRSGGRVTCTQTFSSKPLAGTGKCAAALPANRRIPAVEQPSEPANVNEPPVEEVPAVNEPPTTNVPPVNNETPAANETLMNREIPTPQTPTNQKNPMKRGNRMRKKRMNKMRMKKRSASRSMKDTYITLTVDGKSTKFVFRNLNGSYHICNPETKKCLSRHMSKKIMRVFMYLN